MATGDQNQSGGTGTKLGKIVLICCGVSALIATLITVVSIFLQTKNYRKPLLQRHVIRILIMVPIYCAASWASLISIRVAFYLDPFRDVYEAFTIYTFFQLLIAYIGGERALLIMMHGRAPVAHFWPMSYCFGKVDISDPHTFLAIKRGILQYAWMKPLLAVATIVMKATGTYQEGYIGLSSGYFWTGLLYNISICWSLYDLALFWVCMSQDLQPFRPMPKFLCIKGIIFASWWQGFLLSIFVFLGAVPSDVPGYSPDNLAAAIQDALICFEMPFFAIAHWYAFSWHDYADPTISAGRMPIRYAVRDAFGPRDLIEDTKDTFAGKHYDYKEFDADDNVLAHEESSSRDARMRAGMRYARGGKGKYWIPEPNHDSRTPLLAGYSRARAMSPGPKKGLDEDSYGALEEDDDQLHPDDERLYASARALEFGDWNYPVITAHHADRENQMKSDPTVLTQSTNRNILQPTKDNKRRRKSRIENIQDEADKGRHRDSSSSGASGSKSQIPIVGKLIDQASAEDNSKSDPSQVVDLVVEDQEAEEIERVRARKEGGPGWNEASPKHYVRTFPEDSQEENMREGFDPDSTQTTNRESEHNLDYPFTVGEEGDETNGIKNDEEPIISEEAHAWKQRDVTKPEGNTEAPYDGFIDEREAWAKK